MSGQKIIDGLKEAIEHARGTGCEVNPPQGESQGLGLRMPRPEQDQAARANTPSRQAQRAAVSPLSPHNRNRG